MAKQRYQDPKILTRGDVSRPFYYMLAAVPVVTAEGLKRKRQSFQLGFCDEITVRQAKARKQQILAPINAGRCLIQSQIPFREVARKFEDARIPQLGRKISFFGERTAACWMTGIYSNTFSGRPPKPRASTSKVSECTRSGG